MSGGSDNATGRFAQLVAEIEVAELERGAAIAPLFLWLWEHRVQVRGLLTAGTSWSAIAGALGRVGLVDERGDSPSVEHCRAAWGRVVAFEPMVAGLFLGGEAPRAGSGPTAPEPQTRQAAPEGPSPRLPQPLRAPAVPDAEPAPSLGNILAQRRRSPLADPQPLDLASRERRLQRPSTGEEP